MKPLHKYKNSAERNQAIKENRALLEGFFGSIINYDNPKPLKIGIINDIYALAQTLGLPFSKSFLRRSIRNYTARMKYQYAIAAGGGRYDLQGNAVGVVSEEDKKSALEEIERIKILVKRRHQAKKKRENAKKALKNKAKPNISEDSQSKN